jgi:CDP-diglyceride synthetase
MISDAATRLGKLGSSLVFILLVLALAFAISWPLWSFATANRRAFTLSIGAVLALAVLLLAGRGLRMRILRRSGGPKGANGRRRSV